MLFQPIYSIVAKTAKINSNIRISKVKFNFMI
jgi:hypothetical protein